MTATMPSPQPATRRRRFGNWWRVLGGISLAASAGALVATFAFGALATNGQGTGSASTASVSLTQSAKKTCVVGPMQPGDGTISPGQPNASANEVQCQFTVTYGGSIPAYLGLSVTIASTHAGLPAKQDDGITPPAAPGLYDSSVNGLQVLIKDNQSTPTVYMNSNGSQSNTTGAGTTLGGSVTTGANPSATNLLVSTSTFSSSAQVEFTVDYYLPALMGSSVGNSYEAAASSITLSVRAVQSAGNSTSACSAGRPCSGVTWS